MCRYEETPPRADAIIESMRSMGYDLSMAIADLIDNSIFAGARNIWIDYEWAGQNSWLSITDNGSGMTEVRLKEAMRLGSLSPVEKREAADLGRFGLGLKTASLSQCRIFTVCTKTSAGETSTRCWNIDHVTKTKKWELGTIAPEGAGTILSRLYGLPQGTMILWQKLDRIVEEAEPQDEKARDTFFRKFLRVRDYLAMVFHRYLTPPSNLSIRLGMDDLKPWDPYLRTNPFSRKLGEERYDEASVRVIPYVLPHVSQRSSAENQSGGGLRGWNSQQGFYIYRNRRLIVPGGYLDFNLVPEEHYKLARIQVDIDNSMDADWGIDVRKAAAIPPDRLRSELEKVAKYARAEAAKVYRARIRTSRKAQSAKGEQCVWNKRTRGEKIIYEINRENEVIKAILGELNPSKSWVRKLFHVIESAVPHRLIIMDNADYEDCHVDLPLDMNPPGEELIELCRELYIKHRKSGKNHDQAADIVSLIEPFNTHPAYRAALDAMEERSLSNGQGA